MYTGIHTCVRECERACVCACVCVCVCAYVQEGHVIQIHDLLPLNSEMVANKYV